MAPVSDTVYGYLRELQQAAEKAALGDELSLVDLRVRYCKIFSEWLGDSSESMFAAVAKLDAPVTLPRLVGSAAGYNIVYFVGHHYCVPQSLGPMDLGQLDMSVLPSTILVTGTYRDALQAITEVAKP
jgi:hypothetical protein